MGLSVADYDYAFPPEAVAQVPAGRREDARLLRVERDGSRLVDGVVGDLPSLLLPGDLLVLNEARVAPARLLAHRETGGRVSVLVLQGRGSSAQVLLGARGTPLTGELLDVQGDRWRLVETHGEGRFTIEVESGRTVEALMEAVGRMPLPPYIERDPERDARDALDRERYQTTYATADQPAAAVAAPTAGLHLTSTLLEAAQAAGAGVARLRLDVGEGTFRPLRGETLDEHVMHDERYEIPAPLVEGFAATRRSGGRVVAVGTTVVRALESAVAPDGRTLSPGPATTGLFIRPGHHFVAVDALLTNFHQPRSTLLVLVCAFAGSETIRRAYRHAIESGYRLFSYGDAMFID
jgi:S-adenosylmethionine:tRNA ribosyltransferase-isomerase